MNNKYIYKKTGKKYSIIRIEYSNHIDNYTYSGGQIVCTPTNRIITLKFESNTTNYGSTITLNESEFNKNFIESNDITRILFGE